MILNARIHIAIFCASFAMFCYCCFGGGGGSICSREAVIASSNSFERSAGIAGSDALIGGIGINVFGIKNANAGDQISIISDIEMEEFIREIINPIFKVAKVDSSNTKIFVINDSSVNAFVMDGNVFVNTGLIVMSSKSAMLRGVLAHETGHLVKNHLIRRVFKREDDKKKAEQAALLSAILGPMTMGLGIVAAPMVLLGSMVQGALIYSRENESEADEAAIEYLGKLHQPIDSLYQVMDYFNQNFTKEQEEYRYFMSHPLPKERLERMRIAKAESPYETYNYDCELEKKLQRCKAKILGFFGETGYTTIISSKAPAQCFTGADMLFFKQYKLLHELWRKKDYDKASTLAKKLILANPKDVFLRESYANMLFDMGDVEGSIAMYRQIDSELNITGSHVNLYRMLIASKNKDMINEGIDGFKILLFSDPRNASYYSMISLGYTNLKDTISSLAYNAEANLIMGDCAAAKNLAERSLKLLKKSPNHPNKKQRELMATDIIDACNADKD